MREQYFALLSLVTARPLHPRLKLIQLLLCLRHFSNQEDTPFPLLLSLYCSLFTSSSFSSSSLYAEALCACELFLFCCPKGNLLDKCHPLHYACVIRIHIQPHICTRPQCWACSPICTFRQMYSRCHGAAMVTSLRALPPSSLLLAQQEPRPISWMWVAQGRCQTFHLLYQTAGNTVAAIM